MENRTEPRSGTRPYAVAALALLGPLLGVATQVWAQALLLLCLGVLLLVSPPRRSPGALWWMIFIGLCGLGLVGFLPLRWFEVPEWRRVLSTEFRVELGDLMSPQPWLSLHAFCLLFAGLVFALYLLALDWSQLKRRQAMRCYVLGILLLTVLAMIAQFTGWRPPFWPKVLNLPSGFGIFPNRNQTANVFALAGIVASALAFDSFQRRRAAAWFWTLAAVALGCGLVMAYSRAGILLFFGGLAVWVMISTVLSKSQKAGALSLAGLALALAAFSIFGGETLERFLPKGPENTVEDFRFKVHGDALHLVSSAPWLGQGMGNFAPVFAMSRVESVEQNRTIHPESDWLWVAVEMGWPAVALLGLGFVLWLKQCFPFSNGTDRAIRAAAMVCGLAFVGHSFADVSGHRPGSAWPGLFLASLAILPSATATPSRWVAPVFRCFGVVVVLTAAWWLASVKSDWIHRNAPTAQTLAQLSRQVEELNSRKEFPLAIVVANEALRIAPLSADLYYQRGYARAGDGFSVHGAAWDFATARFLEPRWVQLCVSEGLVWQQLQQPVFAMDAWLEALRRAGKRSPEYYRQMLGWANANTAIRSQLAKLARANPDYFIAFLSYSDRLECDLLIGQLLDAEPKLRSLSSEQRKALFAVWYQRGDRDALISRLASEPLWQKEGWRWLAASHAAKKDYETAYRTARESVAVPSLPKLEANKPLSELERAFHFRNEDLQAGLVLFTAQRDAKRTNDAIDTLQKLQKLKAWPSYLLFIEAELWAEKQDWERAWDALQRFMEKTRQ